MAKRYSDKEIQLIKNMLAEGVPIYTMSKRLKRSRLGLEKKIKDVQQELCSPSSLVENAEQETIKLKLAQAQKTIDTLQAAVVELKNDDLEDLPKVHLISAFILGVLLTLIVSLGVIYG